MVGDGAMAKFVLVHGAWHGGWCWWKVTPLLRAAGHDVYPVTLTGLGERAHLGTPQTDLDLHIEDVRGVLRCEGLTDVVLVGHGYGGMVISGIVDRVPERVVHLVYLDAYDPAPGQAVVDIFPAGREQWPSAAAAHGLHWRIPPPAAADLGITNEFDLRRLAALLAGHPLASVFQPLRLARPAGAGRPRTFIACTDKPASDSFTATAARVREDPAWRYRELATGHDAMITMPRETADLLLEVVALL
jgi:pimeloyl-ACP methyl ester carboxylesterase